MSDHPKISAKNSIATRLLKRVFYVYIIFALFVTFGHVYMEYKREKAELIGELNTLYVTFGKPLAIAVWDADKEQLSSLLEGLITSSLITGVSLTEIEGGTERNFGLVVEQQNLLEIADKFGTRLERSTGSKNIFGYRYPLQYSEAESPNLLGHVYLFSSKLIIYNKLKYQIIYILFSALIKASVLWLVFIWYGKRILTVPLSALAKQAGEISMDRLEPLKLPYADNPSDEVSILRNAFNKMVRNLQLGVKKQKQLFSELNSYKNDLQDMVEQRTEELQKTNEILLSQVEERELAEDRVSQYGMILENSLNEIYIFDARTLQFLIVNKGARNNLEYTWDELKGYTPLSIKPEYSRTEFDEMLLPLRTGEKDIHIFQTVHKRKSGTTYDVEVHLQLMDFKNIQVFVAIVLDISEKQLLEERLRQSHKMEAVGTIAGGIAHDFNNILSIIIGNTELALDSCQDQPEVEESLADIKSASLRARDVIQQLLSFSRKQKTVLEPVKINTVVLEAIKLLRSSIPSSVTIDLSVTNDPGYAIANGTQVYQILLNLCTNGAHALGDDGGTLNVGLRKSSISHPLKTINGTLPPGMYVQLSVEDQGCGISPENIDRIFDPYFTTKAVDKGSGMGLAVVHGIVSASGGGITVNSQLNSGTLVTVYIPGGETPTEHVVKDSEKPENGGEETVLLVDDEKEIIKVGTRVLKRLGYKVISFSDPLLAHDYFQDNAETIDLVLTDLTMPKLNGLQLSQKIRSISPDIPVILCSGYNELVNKQDSSASPVTSFLQKPFQKTKLAQAVRQALAGNQS